MRERVGPSGVAVAAVICALVAIACTSRHDAAASRAAGASAPSAPDGRPLLAVSLPDLSKMTASVQTQIRTTHASLSQRIESRNTAPLELADAYGELGKLLKAADYPDAAEPCLLNAQTLAPDDSHWPYYLAHVYRDRGDLAQSRTFFERALELQPDDVATLVWLGEISLSQGRPDEAEPRFAKALSLQPKSLSARFGLGRSALARQDYRNAVAYLEDVLKMDPGAAGAHYPLGLAYNGLGNAKKAELHLRQREDHKILPADPLMVDLEELLESPQTYESRGIRALDRSDWTEAAALFRKGLELAPASPSLRHRLGTALYMAGDRAAAQVEFERVVRDSPDYSRGQYSLGVLLQDQGRHADAIAHFSAALRSRSAYHEARLRLATSLRRSGRPQESLQHYEQLLSVNAGLTEARFGHAMALVQLGRYQEARDRLAEGMKLYADQPVFAHGLARLLAAAPDDRVRDGARALRLVEAQLRDEQRSLDLGETMAMALADLGRYTEAASLQRDLITGAERGGLHDVAARLTQNLGLYEHRKPCRTPWPEGELP